MTVTVRNTSARASDEVAPLYLTPPAFDGAPHHALRGVQRVRLQPGEANVLTFRLTPRDLSFVNAAGERGLIPGRYQATVGSGQPGTGVAARPPPMSCAATRSCRSSDAVRRCSFHHPFQPSFPGVLA